MSHPEQHPNQPEAAAATPQPENSASRKRWLARIIGVGALASGLLLTAASYATDLDEDFGRMIAYTHPEMKMKDEKVVAESIFAGPLTLACRAQNLLDVSDSEATFQATLGGKEIPGLWEKLSAKDSKNPAKKQTVVGLTTCINNVDKAGNPTVTITEDKDVDATFAATTIDIKAEDGVVVSAQFVPGNKLILPTHGEAWDGGSALSQGASAITGGVCKLGGIAGDAVGLLNGNKSEKCDEVKKVFTRFKDTAEAKNANSFDLFILKAVEKEGSKQLWDEHTWPSIMDSYACEALAQKGPDAVNQLRFTSTGMPKFDTTMFTELEKKGVIKSTDDVKVDAAKVKIGKPESYEYQCTDGAVMGPDGKWRVTPKASAVVIGGAN